MLELCVYFQSVQTKWCVNNTLASSGSLFLLRHIFVFACYSTYLQVPSMTKREETI